MLFLISDLHGGVDCECFYEYAKTAKEGDTLLILGDLELAFRDTEENRRFTEFFLSLTCEIAFIDGNHENFDYLYAFPQEEWNGGRVHRLSPHIVHLMRGYIFRIQGRTFFTMGGCKSTQKWVDSGLWWPQEVPDEEEIARAYKVLAANNHKVDYVLTHKYRIDSHKVPPMTLEGLSVFLEEQVEYKHWYSGHWHRYEEMDEKHTVIGQKPVLLP